jgi:hypothetical protein
MITGDEYTELMRLLTTAVEVWDAVAYWADHNCGTDAALNDMRDEMSAAWGYAATRFEEVT